MDEFDLIRRYFTRPPDDDAVLLGVGDDGALLRPEPGFDLICAVDTLVEDVHFPATLGASDVAYRSVAVNVSDIAAMGGQPKWMLLSLTLPESDASWLADFSRGLFEAARSYSTALVGGDTTRGRQLTISIHLLGVVPAGQALTRSGARCGDDIWITGSVGDAAAGLRLMSRQLPGNDDVVLLRQRFARPSVRVRLATAIGRVATAAIDVSDGLFADLGKLLDASAAGASLDLDRLPLSTSLRRLYSGDARDLALGGGDDYELCFTAAAEHAETIEAAAVDTATPVTKIGTVTASKRITCLAGGVPVEIADRGYRHFAES